MQPQRIDLADLKAQLTKKIGPERSKRYFYILTRFFSKKISKGEFNKFCFRLLGSENLPLHNHFIRSILKNACQARTPPPIQKKGHAKSVSLGVINRTLEDGHERSGFGMNHISSGPAWSNGIGLPKSPRKGRSAIRDRKLRDRLSPLGPNGKVDCVSHHLVASEGNGMKTLMQNGSLTPSDYQRVMQHPHGLAERPDDENSRLKHLTDPSVSPFSKGRMEAVVVEEGEEVEQVNCSNVSRGPLLAPLGIPFCSASIGGARKSLPVPSICDISSCFDGGGLHDTDTLRKYMEQIAVVQGLEVVSLECANLLNNMLDVYLKRLVSSCLGLAGARSEYEVKHLIHKQPNPAKLINVIQPSNYINMQNSSRMPATMQEQRRLTISLLDFKTAVELNPQQLGEDWPLLREKISMHLLDE